MSVDATTFAYNSLLMTGFSTAAISAVAKSVQVPGGMCLLAMRQLEWRIACEVNAPEEGQIGWDANVPEGVAEWRRMRQPKWCFVEHKMC